MTQSIFSYLNALSFFNPYLGRGFFNLIFFNHVIFDLSFRATEPSPSERVRQNHGGEADARSRASGPAYHPH